MTAEIVNNVKILLGITDDAQDCMLFLITDMVMQSVLNHLNRKCLPKNLQNVVANLILAEYKSLTTDGTTGAIASISEGGSSVSFDTAALQTRLQDRISNVKQMNAFRLAYRFD